MARFVREYKASTGKDLQGELTWRTGNQKGWCVDFDAL